MISPSLWLYAYENFYSCRLTFQIEAALGYTPTKISTLVDITNRPASFNGYTPTKISTLVDTCQQSMEKKGYTPTKISTLVDCFYSSSS